MIEIDWDCPRQARRGRVGQCRRNLEEALSPNKVGMERRPQGVLSPSRAIYLTSPFVYQCIVHHRHERFFDFQAREHLTACRSKQGIRIKALPFKESVGGRPVVELLSTGT